MNDETKHGNTPAHGDYERQDLGAGGVLYFFAGLLVVGLLLHLLLAGLYDVLDKRARMNQPPVSPLVTNAPEDTRKVTPNYPARAFPDPRLETDESTQLNDIRVGEEERLYSYGWVDEKAGTVHIPIERAMDLLAQRGLPTYSPNSAEQTQAKNETTKNEATKKDGAMKEAPAKEKDKRGKKS